MQVLFTILLNFQYAIQNRTDYFNNQLKKQTLHCKFALKLYSAKPLM